MPTDGSEDALYRVVDADGEPLWDSIYEDEKEALSRRAREMSEHPDGDEVAIKKYVLVDHP